MIHTATDLILLNKDKVLAKAEGKAAFMIPVVEKIELMILCLTLPPPKY